MKLTRLSLDQASNLIAQRKISPLELTQAHLDKIEKLDPRLNSFITITADIALQKAKEAEVEIQQGKIRGPLHGIPMALKDLCDTRGVRTTAGSKFFAGNTPERDAEVVRKLTAAGMVLLGKLNMHEIALGVTNENIHYGDCNNPWDLRRITGGSSGGSGAALAAGLCLGSLGSDTGGSIRIPASLCGVVGLKPTFGRVSKRGVTPLSWNLDHVGPMARQVKDVALLLQVIAAYDPEDPYAINIPTGEYISQLAGGVDGWRIALASGQFFDKADGGVLELVQAAADVFETLGASVIPIDIPHMREAALANGLMTTSDAAVFHRQRLKSHPEDFGTDVLQRLRAGAANTSEEYILARRTQRLMRFQFEKFFESYDILLTPATPFTAPLRGSEDAIKRARQLTRFTAPFNLTGLPAISLPCGFDRTGMPVGLQIVAAPWAEAQVLRAANAYEMVTTWHLSRPKLST
jgi:aspartyl-tRNA(Asn)/glutamyl-tRNA(Gln) amidotransferase subunit A